MLPTFCRPEADELTRGGKVPRHAVWELSKGLEESRGQDRVHRDAGFIDSCGNLKVLAEISDEQGPLAG